jgi:hypothetical protein
VKALKADGARAELLAWRNRYAATPANADQYAGGLSKLLAWARNQGLTSADPMREWPWIYHPDRSDIVWTAPELEAVCAKADPERSWRSCSRPIPACARRPDPADLVGDRRDAHRPPHLEAEAGGAHPDHAGAAPGPRRLPSARRRRPDEPAAGPDGADEERAALGRLDAQQGLAGRPAAAAAKLPQILEKRWHDMRGTYATSLHRDGYEDDEVDRIMGWKKGNSEQTRAAYVAGDVVAHAAIAAGRARKLA